MLHSGHTARGSEQDSFDMRRRTEAAPAAAAMQSVLSAATQALGSVFAAPAPAPLAAPAAQHGGASSSSKAAAALPPTAPPPTLDVATLSLVARELLDVAPSSFQSSATGQRLSRGALTAALAAMPQGHTAQNGASAAASIAEAFGTDAPSTASNAAGTAPAPAPAARPLLKPPPAALVHIKTIGSGGFGRVSLVRDAATKRIFALKRIRKGHILSHNGPTRCEWLRREREIMHDLAMSAHPFITRMYASYADTTCVYLLLEAAMGGDLYWLLSRLDLMRSSRYDLVEIIARFHTASLTLALQHIHAHDVVYRDLKPENVLIDGHGFVKLCDFGLAKKVPDRTYTRCGTPDYTAPEMLRNQGVNQACDWWGLGILLFELLVGSPPFSDPDGDEMRTYTNITKGDLHGRFPKACGASQEARALVQGLLTVRVAHRLGYLKGGAKDVIDHPWLASYDFDGLVNLTIVPPWLPNLTAADDTQYFEADDVDDEMDEAARVEEEARLEAERACD